MITSSERTEREVLRIVLAEFAEMPGIRLTMAQCCRLWNLEEPVCARVLAALIDQGFLARDARAWFHRAGDETP